MIETQIRRLLPCVPLLALAAFFVATSLVATDAAAQDVAPLGSESDPPEAVATASNDDSSADDTKVRAVPETAESRRERALEVRQSIKQQIESTQGEVHLYQIVEEVVDELASDMEKLNPSVVSPMAMKPVRLSSNLSKEFGGVVDATIVSTLANQTNIVVKDCVACGALRSRIEGNDWVVTSGLVSQDDYTREAERLGVKTFLDARFSFFPNADIISMQVKLIRAEDGAIVWAETYRSDATTAAILRTGDRVLSRAERIKELERLIEQRPDYGYRIHLGGSYIPYDSPNGGIFGGAAGGLFYESFGVEKRWIFGLGGDAFFNPSEQNALVGGFLGVHVLYNLLGTNLVAPDYFVGGSIEGFLAGTEGNSVAFSGLFDVIFAERLGIGTSLMYFVPVTFAGQDLGGLGFKLRASMNW